MSNTYLPTTPPSTSTPTPAPTNPPTVSGTLDAGASAQVTQFGAVGSGYTGSIGIPASNASAIVALTFSPSAPGSAPVVSSIKRIPQTIGVSLTPIVYISFTPSATFTIQTTPSFSFTLAPGFSFANSSALTYVGFLDPTSSTGWVNLIGPGTASGSTYSFTAGLVPMTFKAGVTYVFAWYSTLAVVAPLSTPTPSPTPTPSTTQTSTGNGAPLTGPALGPNTGWGPPAVANALKFPVQDGFNGSGIGVAIVSGSNVLSSDLTAFSTYFQIPQTTRAFAAREIDGANATQVGSDLLESTLDVETIMGLAPGANVYDYVIPSLTDQDFTDAFNQVIVDKYANIASVSFAGCESNVPTATLNAESAVFANAAANGVTFIAASGDSGSACNYSSNPNEYANGVQYPASDPNVISVGGTESTAVNGLTTTASWNDNFNGMQEASGGGVSAVFAIPAFQKNISGVASSQYRNVPDIAMPAFGVSTYQQGSWQLIAGTSWAAPQFAALLAEVYQFCNSAFNNPASLPYEVYASAPADFLDITSGNNAFSLVTGYTTNYMAQVGYDNVSGLGVPFGMPFANTICPNRVATARMRSLEAAQSLHATNSVAYVTDATPRIPDISDLGRRAANEITRIQIVMSPNGSIASNEAATLRVLQSSGFTIDKTYSNHLVIDADAPSSSVERLFSTEMHDIRQQSGLAYMPISAITIPASLAPYVAGVILDTAVTFSSRH